jgi:Mn2+/Fe2+ NRAMP family transporter
MVMMMLLASRPKGMGHFTLTRGLVIVGWAATGVMALATVGMVATVGH